MKHPRNHVCYLSANAPALAHIQHLRPSSQGCSLGLGQAPEEQEQVVAAQNLRQAHPSRDHADGQLMAWEGAVSASQVEALVQDACRECENKLHLA